MKHNETTLNNSNRPLLNTLAPKIEICFHYGKKDILDASWWHGKNQISPQNQLYYIFKGEISLMIDNKEYIAKAGDMVLLPAGIQYDYSLTNLQYAHKFWLHFDLTIDRKNIFNEYEFSYIVRVKQPERVYSLFEKLLDLKINNTIEQTLVRSNLLCRLLSYYFEHCSIQLKSNDSCIWNVVEFINNNYIDKLTLADLANRASLSINQFIRRFEHIMGCSPIQYVNYLRVDRAKLLIENSDKSISEILAEVGFYDFSHFTKIFKRYYGYSPSQYRKIKKQP